MIEVISNDNLDELLPLIRAYLEFYEVKDVSDNRNREFFSQFGLGNPLGCQFAYREQGNFVGFAMVYFSFATSITAKVAVLNDLYVVPKKRGLGIARNLIEHCRDFARENGALRLQWSTAPGNEPAQKLYDSLAAKKSTWLFYTYNT